VHFEDPSRAAAVRLAQLLGDGRGAEALVELQKLNQAQTSPRPQADIPFGVPADPTDLVGVWRPEPTDDGTALRRDDAKLDVWLWRNTEYVPAQGNAKRVVLLGESAARGWLFDPVFTPADVLERNLQASAPGQYQVIDLARTAADLDTLAQVVRNLPRIEADVLVLFAGNNLTFPPLDDSYRDVMAHALRAGGYGAMRARFVDAVVLPRVASLLAQVRRLQRDHGVRVVMVVPESNLRGWVPAPDIDVPALRYQSLQQWYVLRRAASTDLEHERWAQARENAAAMSSLDAGTSPVSWYLQGRAAEAQGDAAAARALLQTARDTVCGLLLDHVNNVITDVQRLQTEFAQRNGIRCVDLSDVLASAGEPLLPDARYFLDNCHLTDEAIERVMSRVTDAILDLPEGSTPSGVGAPPATRAVAHALAAAYCAYRNQPADAVRRQLQAALDAETDAATRFLNQFLSILEDSGPKWTHPALLDLLTETPQAFMLCLQMAQTRQHSVGFWTLRDCAHEQLGRRRTRSHGGWATQDILALPDGRGFRTTSFMPGRAYHEATSDRTSLAFALDEAVAGVIHLTYRLPRSASLSPATVKVNGRPVGQLRFVEGWSSESADVPVEACRAGVNWVTIEWPIPDTDADAQRYADAAALARRMFPRVLPVFGALFAAFFDRRGRGAEARDRFAASRCDFSAGWTTTEAARIGSQRRPLGGGA
jgi:hypothetical protein